jgi:AraC-like DNA-binding protein
MVRNRHDAIDRVDFAAPAGVPPAIEVMSLDQLHTRAGRGLLGRPQRPTFHHLLTLRRGTLSHTVDFARLTLTPGEWLWVRPGQVQQWADLSAVDGTLTLFEPDFLDRATAVAARLDDPHAPTVYRPVADDRQRLTAAGQQLAATFASPGALPLDVRQAVLRHLLAVLVLQLTHLAAHPAESAPQPNQTFLRFRDAVERDFVRTHRLEDYAHALGYSARTLSRAAQAMAGVGGKGFIDRRIVLEAKRLLAHSDHTAAQIAARLGFTSATNFSKYFQARTGVTPIAFRAGIGATEPAPRRTR